MKAMTPSIVGPGVNFRLRTLLYCNGITELAHTVSNKNKEQGGKWCDYFFILLLWNFQICKQRLPIRTSHLAPSLSSTHLLLPYPAVRPSDLLSLSFLTAHSLVHRAHIDCAMSRKGFLPESCFPPLLAFFILPLLKSCNLGLQKRDREPSFKEEQVDLVFNYLMDPREPIIRFSKFLAR